jgi:hypothetical protein
MSDNTCIKTILILAANPKTTSRLRLDEEIREIDNGLRVAKKREQFRLVQKWAVRQRDFYRAILECQPQIVHFCGHGTGNDGIVLEDENGQQAPLETEALSRLFKLFAVKGVECVVLNTCYSEKQAEAISQYIKYVIGMNKAIGDKAAIDFALAFYDALGAGEDVQFAYDLGCSQLVGLKEDNTPVLKVTQTVQNNWNDLENILDQKQLGEVEYLFFDDTFYSDCYKQVEKSGALIRLKAPSKWGKTYLMTQIIQHGIHKGYNGVRIDFQEPEKVLFNDLKRFLRWFCGSIAEELGLPDKLDEHWREQLAANRNCTNYLERYLLQAVQTPLILGLDNFDLIFGYESIARDFLPLVRSWHENARTKKNTWGKLRLVIAYSKENYIPIDRNKSPLNAGKAIRIPELSQQQLLRLVQHYRLNLSVDEVYKMMSMMGGHPYLINIALDQLANYELTLEELLINAATDAGIYGDYLSEYLSNLKENPQTAEAMKQVVTSKIPVRIETEIASKLRDMGLIKFKGNNVIPLFHLYRIYFSEHLR